MGCVPSIFFVTRKPPVMLTAEIPVASAARVWPVLVGNKPPPIAYMPPTAVIPEMAFVTAINGECNAGATPHTT